MSYFFWGMIILFVVTTIYYIVFLSLSYYWHEKRESFVVLPLLFTFDFFIIGFLIISVASILFYYLPDIIILIQNS